MRNSCRFQDNLSEEMRINYVTEFISSSRVVYVGDKFLVNVGHIKVPVYMDLSPMEQIYLLTLENQVHCPVFVSKYLLFITTNFMLLFYRSILM